MSEGLLLDSHTLLWLDAQAQMKPDARFAIGRARASQKLFFSHISMWEVGLALHKKGFERRPNLRGLSAGAWFTEVARNFGIVPVLVSEAVALEAAEVPGVYGYGDPGDCFLIATARVNRLSFVTRDAKIIDLAARLPEYLTVVAC